ncbi:MAG: MarR family transcriptional regulator [Lachnospiraceae bacterium]|jgi:DNA-binding MarR family transcriptional regulator|nr:MarR family transcriptional regulator [Lachnospiraceae bacterium]
MDTSKHAARYINNLSNKLRRRIDAFASRAIFSGSQGRVLHFVLAQSHDVFQKDIEEEFGLRPPTATQILKKMEQSGLIRREVTAEDGRMKRILVSEKARQYQDIVIADITGLEKELTRDIPQEEMAVFFKVIGKMMENVS